MNLTSATTARAAAAVLALALALCACGGGSAEQQSSSCSLTSTAGCGGNPTTPTTPTTPSDPAAQAASLSLLFSSAELPSAGGEVTVTAVVKNGASAALPGAAIAFSADSGILTGAEAVTDKNGQAKVLLGTGGSNMNRRISVLAKVGAKSASGAVEVVGTSLAISGPAVLSLGASADLTVTLRDSAKRPIAGAPLTLSAKNGNALTVKGGGPASSDAQGRILLSLLGSRLGPEAVSVTALGTGAAMAVSVESTELRISPAVGVGPGGAEVLAEVATGACQAVDVHYEKLGVGQSGQLNLSTSRGRLYADSACLQPLAGAVAVVNGNAPRNYLSSVNSGVATLNASISGGPSAQTRVEFVAPLTPTATVTLQAEPAVIGSNSGAATTERSVLTAVVRDGTAANNLIKGATVVYTIVADPSGGYLAQPSSDVTGSDGAARASYVAGPADSGKDGAVIEAHIQGAGNPGASARVLLSVARKALSIQFGTGNSVIEYSPSLLQQEFAVLVSDSAGNGVADVGVSAAVWPTRYRKGYFEWLPDSANSPDTGSWVIAWPNYICANEDLVRKGIYDGAYDVNGNGVLDPGIPITVSGSGKTDALGLARIALNYPRDRGQWVQVELTVRGSVAGTEALARSTLWLPALAKDFSNRHVTPPGQQSPYGQGPCGSPL
ncbi:Ig-like domain-containing protein [Janthinobacterium fluminis]|uniref:Ig-like domain-containing protein n=1 Tax=Janthinobacterium fluminis TaxID=2987524 RepID=A0ABT5JVE0_9BURK|nr:Ig-like domain-containing protein [Janthinobacterium fluminis]MDC8756691.1 Ig-like domain-containing protein [Janthinobacterium fluminis]